MRKLKHRMLSDVLKVIEETLSKLAVKFRKTSPS